MYKKTFFVFVLVFLSYLSDSQNKTFDLSRQDSAKINTYLQQAEEFKAKNYLKQESDCYNNG